MSSGSLWVILGFFVVAVFLVRVMDQRCKRQIENHMFRIGAKDIVVTRLWLRWPHRDKDENMYEVTYRDKHGHRCKAECKVRPSLFFEHDIYWKYPPKED